MRIFQLAWMVGVAGTLAGCFSGPDSLIPYSDLSPGPDMAHRVDLSVNHDLANGDLLNADLLGDMAEPLTVSLTVTANATMVVAATADVDAPDGSQVTIEYGPTLALQVPVQTAAGGHVTVPLLGLTPGATNRVRATARDAAGRTGSDEKSLDTDALPGDFPVYTLNLDDGSTTGFVAVSFFQSITAGYNVVIDRQGHPFWYEANHAGLRAEDFQRQSNGNFFVWQLSNYSFLEMDLFGNVLKTWTDPSAPFNADGHDFVLQPNGNALFIGFDEHTYTKPDTTTFTGLDTVVDEQDPSGNTVFHWEAYPEVTLDETSPTISLTQNPADIQHPNSLTVLDDGALLLSLRHTSTLYKISRETGNIVWRLGGTKSDFTFVHDPENGPSFQHYARETPDGDIMLFDNGNTRAPPYTRVVEYRLDENAHTATLIWEIRHDPDVFCSFMGSVQRLANGNTLIDWASATPAALIEEYDPFTTIRWQLQTANGQWIYRALYLPSVY